MMKFAPLFLRLMFCCAGLFSVYAVAADQPETSRQEGPQRIVSVGSDMTEIAFALGMGSQIVATDTTSSWPLAAQQTPKVGYLRNLAAEGVLSLAPDVLLLASAAGPGSTLRQLATSGIRMHTAPGSYTLEAVREKIRMTGQALRKTEAAAVLLKQFDREVIALHAQQALLTDRPRVVFLLSVAKGGLQAAGQDTAAQAVLELIKAENVFSHQGYKAVSSEAMIQSNPAVILMMAQSIRRSGGRRAVLNRPAVSLTEAGKHGRLVEIDGPALLAFGPRVAASAIELAQRVRRLPH